MENLNSHLTAIERDKMSYPSRILLKEKLINGKVLDFGCGLGKDVETFKEKGFDIQGYDPHYFPNYPLEQFDIIICHYVLNVIFPKEQSIVIHEISKLLKKGGRAYLTVRRDIKKEGFRKHFVHKIDTYQCNVILPFKSIFKDDNMEIYEYQHYTFLNALNPLVSPFFIDNDKDQTGELLSCFAIRDKYPVSIGHTLVIPKRKVANYFELTFNEQSALWFLVNLLKKDLEIEFNPDGFNIGINIGEKAGQTVHHAHVHLIPRYTGDVAEPRGGVRGVVPEKQKY